MVGNNAQEKAAALLNCFVQFFLAIFARLELFFVEPDETIGILKLADYEARDFQVWRCIADKDAAAGPLLFTICFVHEVRVSNGRGVFLPPATMQFGRKKKLYWFSLNVPFQAPETWSRSHEVLIRFTVTKDQNIEGIDSGGKFGNILSHGCNIAVKAIANRTKNTEG